MFYPPTRKFVRQTPAINDNEFSELMETIAKTLEEIRDGQAQHDANLRRLHADLFPREEDEG